ncbi:MAG TPA: CPBP family intramembrane metalloprotease [Anaerolineae bacterium]|nr:CPBP family intramembrane metalloprotease [Anaerolineae bacterium]
MIDRKGIFSYLLITFALTYAIEGALILPGFRITDLPPAYGQFVIAGVMWVPALATVLTIKFVTHEGFATTNLRLGPWQPYLKTAMAIPTAFAAIYGLTWLLGLGQPDWQLSWLRELMASAGADVSEVPSPSLFLPAIFLATLTITPFINSLFGFGEEFGWRGYLLPRLMPLGKARAYTLVGVIWGLWHTPLILVGFNYPGYPILGVVWMAGMTTALGLYINELTLRYRSSILAGWIHGVFNSQGYGIWRILFPEVNPLLGGMTGLIGIIVWLALGFWEIRRQSAER